MPDGIVRIKVGLNTDTAVKDAERLGKEVQDTLNKVSTGELNSKTLTFIKNLTIASNRAQKLARDLEAFGRKKIPTEEYAELSKRLKKSQSEFDKMLMKQDEMIEKGQTSGKAWEEIDHNLERLGTLIREDEAELKNLVNTGKAFTLGSQTTKYKDMQANLNTANQATNILLQKYQEMAEAERLAAQEAEEMSKSQEDVSEGNEETAESADKASRSMKRYGRSLGDVGRTILHTIRTALNRLVSVFRQLSHHLSLSNRHQRGLATGMKHSLRTILTYTLGVSSLLALIRRGRGYVSEAFKVMAQEIPEVNETISELGTSFKQLKASFGTMLQPLLQSLAPILNSIVQKLVAVMNSIARFFATLTGQDYIYEATVANYDYAKSVEEAEKANEGALASFDKLNVIAKDNAKNTLALTKDTVTYKKVEINPEDTWYTRLAKKIADGWKKADLSEATNDIANKLAELLDSIKWEDIRSKTTRFAHTIATGINGITLPDENTGKSALADSIGNLIAEALQTSISTIDTFVTDVDWENLGLFIATTIESLKDRLRTNDTWKEAGRAIGHLFQGLVKLGLQLLVEDNIFEGLGTDFSNFLNSLIEEGMKENPETHNTYLKDFGISLSTGFVNILKEIEAFLDGSSDELAEAVNQLFQGIDLFEIAKHIAIVFIKGLKTGLKMVLSAGLGALGITVDGDTADFLAEALGIGLLGAKIAKLVTGITGSGGLLSAFKKKDDALGTQSKKLSAEKVAVGALAGVLGVLGLNALSTAGNVRDGAQVLDGAIGDVVGSITDVAGVGMNACKDLEDETTKSINSMETSFKEFNPAINPVDTTAYNNAIATTQQTISTIEQMWANSHPKQGSVQTSTPGTTTSTSTTPQTSTSTTGVPTWKKLGYNSYEEYEKAVYDNLEQKKSFNPETTTPLWQKLGYNPLGILDDATKEAHKKIEGAPYYELSQQGAKAEAELREQTVKANVQKFEDFIRSYPENEQAVVAKALSDEMALFGYQDLRDVWESNNETDFFIKRVGRNLDPYSLVNLMGDSSHSYLDSLKKGLSNLMKWLPFASSSVSFPIPFLAQGAVIPPNRPFMAMLGDQRQGTNIEAPLSAIEQAVSNVLSRIQIKNLLEVKGDPHGMFKVTQKEAEIFYNQHGYSAFK